MMVVFNSLDGARREFDVKEPLPPLLSVPYLEPEPVNWLEDIEPFPVYWDTYYQCWLPIPPHFNERTFKLDGDCYQEIEEIY